MANFLKIPGVCSFMRVCRTLNRKPQNENVGRYVQFHYLPVLIIKEIESSGNNERWILSHKVRGRISTILCYSAVINLYQKLEKYLH